MAQRNVGIIARLSFREAARRRVLLGAAVLSALFLAVYGAGLWFIHDDLSRSGQAANVAVAVAAYNLLQQLGLYAVYLLAALLTVLVAVSSLAGEIESETLQSIAARPIRRWELLCGKWLGLAAILTLYLGVLTGGVLIVSRVITGYSPPHIARGLALMELDMLVILNVSLAVSTRLPALGGGVCVLGAFATGFLGGWMEQIGAGMGNSRTVAIGIVSSLIMPTEALWRRAAYEMRSVLADTLSQDSLFYSALSVPSTTMIVYGLLYALAAMVIAIRLFDRRDL